MESCERRGSAERENQGGAVQLTYDVTNAKTTTETFLTALFCENISQNPLFKMSLAFLGSA
jgi:hypothetical protein